MFECGTASNDSEDEGAASPVRGGGAGAEAEDAIVGRAKGVRGDLGRQERFGDLGVKEIRAPIDDVRPVPPRQVPKGPRLFRVGLRERRAVVVEGVEEGWMVAPEIAKAGVPVIVDPQDDLPGSFETLGSRLDNAARLHAAGVAVAINGSRDFNNLRQERLNAGLAVANGLPYSAALAGVTLVPAKIWGQDAKIGSLEVGKLADVVVWNGDPLETTSWPTTVLVGGVEQPKDGRHEQLKARYVASDPGGYPPAYR